MLPDLGGYLYAWLEIISTSSTPACCLVASAPIFDQSSKYTRLIVSPFSIIQFECIQCDH